MTDTDEPQASGSDYPDAQELICSWQKEPYKVHACETNTQMECSCSRQKNAAPEESSDELNSIHKPSAEVLLDSSDSEIDLSAAGGSEYHPKCSIAPSKQERRSQPSRQQAESVAGVPDNESSSDSSLSPQSPVKSSETSKKQKSKLNLKAIFAYHFRGKKFKAAAHRKYKSGSGKKKKKKKYVSTQMPTGRPPLTASPQEQKRRLLDRGFQFPFVEKHYGKKHIPLKMVLGYEQAAAKGYFQYIEVLKYEEHLKKALKALQASEDLERECLVVRKHKYLDDEGPISPIQEMNDDDSLNSDSQDNPDARVVENSSFIISSKIPNKKKSKPETKRAKSTEVIEVEEEDDCAAENSGLLQGSPR
ncbi:TATA box-binding protein-associated factor RNA polymerase I subunit D isoform X2 [Gymnogyps californianus]|uniref:TATA box-binding protein-associated factor RNA polymerase I subunit D isoform X2 n=1 Tax=Gymnogyps californianus TaxID=33616 RepID=UPI0021C63637|nr:TATA box-binding protein-associated factor RNA polymerase I subunit D isoform X2 [Gymnogyps californianus]